MIDHRERGEECQGIRIPSLDFVPGDMLWEAHLSIEEKDLSNTKISVHDIFLWDKSHHLAISLDPVLSTIDQHLTSLNTIAGPPT